MKLTLKKGTTSKRLAIFVQDSSATDGSGLSGLVHNSAGLTWYYWREDAGDVAGTQVTLATATRGTFASGGFIEKDATNMPGFYEIGVPDAALASGASWVVMVLRGATNMAPVTIEIELIDNNAKDVFDRLGAPSGADISADIQTRATQADILSDGTPFAGANIDAAITSRLAPTTAGRTLDVTTGGATGIDWGNIENKTATVDLSATDINLVDTATTVTNRVNSNLQQILGSTITEAVAGQVAGGFSNWFDVGTPANNINSAPLGTAMRGTDNALTSISASDFATDAIDANVLATDAADEIADHVWDEVITGGNHNVNNSAAKFLREAAEAVAMVRGTAQSATSTTLTLASGDVTADDILNGESVKIVEGTGLGQERIITDSVAATDEITVDRAWTTNPDDTSVYAIGGAAADIRMIDGSAPAADNLLAFFIDTGFNASNSTIGTTTTNTDMRGTDNALTSISSTDFSADAIEAAALATDAVNEIRDSILSDSTAFPGASITEDRLAELDAANLPSDIDQIKDDLPNRPTKNVALSNFSFLMVDSSDNVTPKTGLTVSGTISQDGGAFASLTNSVTEIGNGIYKVNLTQAEMNADVIVLRFTATNANDRFITILTEPN